MGIMVYSWLIMGNAGFASSIVLVIIWTVSISVSVSIYIYAYTYFLYFNRQEDLRCVKAVGSRGFCEAQDMPKPGLSTFWTTQQLWRRAFGLATFRWHPSFSASTIRLPVPMHTTCTPWRHGEAFQQWTQYHQPTTPEPEPESQALTPKTVLLLKTHNVGTWLRNPAPITTE